MPSALCIIRHTGGKYLNKDEMLVNRKKKDNEQVKNLDIGEKSINMI